jgi:hypothetical protein
MMALVASGWGLGVLARRRGQGFFKFVGALGVLAILLLPVAYDLVYFDGNCLNAHAATRPCSMSERFWNSLELGLGLSVPPAIMWLVAFAMSSRMQKQ